jgi:hypothetical protein
VLREPLDQQGLQVQRVIQAIQVLKVTQVHKALQVVLELLGLLVLKVRSDQREIQVP